MADQTPEIVSDSEWKWAISCYIPVLNAVFCLLSSVRMVNSRFCLLHARQGLVLFLFWALTVFVGIFSSFLSMMFWGVFLFMHVLGLFYAIYRKSTQLPIFGQISILIPDHFLFKLLTGKSPEKPI